MIRKLLNALRARRVDEEAGFLRQRDFTDAPRIRPDQIAAGCITPDKLASGDPREDKHL